MPPRKRWIGKKLCAVRDKKGRFKDVPTYSAPTDLCFQPYEEDLQEAVRPASGVYIDL